MLGAFLTGLKSIGSMGLKKAAVQGAKEFAKGKAKDFITGRGRKKRGKGGGGGGTYGGGGSQIIRRTGSTAIVPVTPMVPGELARPEDVQYTEPERPITLESIADQLKRIVGLTKTLERIVKKQYRSKKKANEKARIEADKEKKREREEKREGLNLGGKALGVGRKIADKFNLLNFFTQLILGTISVFLVKNIDKVVGALKFVKENLSLVLKSIYSFSKALELIKPKFLKAIKSGKELLGKFTKPIGIAFSAVGKGIRGLFKRIGDLIPNIVKRTFSALRGVAKGIASVPAKALQFLNPFKSREGAKATKSVIRRYAQRFGRSAAVKKFGKGKVVSAVGKGFVGRKVDAAGKFIRRGAKKVSVGATRGVQSVAKKLGMSAKLAKKLRIPVIGPLISVAASLLSGEPIQQALFKGSGAALGGLLGTLIPIPVVGTLIGELIGEYFGDLAYTLFMGGGPEAAGNKLKEDIKKVLSIGETAIKWAGDGMKRMYEAMPKFKIPKFLGRDLVLAPLNSMLGGLLDGKKIQDIEIPNPLWLINPLNIADKVGIFYKSFFTRDNITEGEVSEPKTPKPNRSDYSSGRSGAKQYQKDVKEWKESQQTKTTPEVQPQEQMIPGQPQQSGGAYRSGLRTGASQHIGGSSDYHIDTKFAKNLPIEQKIAMVDQLARGYAAQGRKMEFSNSAVSGEVWNPNASMEEKIKLYNRVTAAHGHSVHSNWDSLDYYNPTMDETRFGSSVEGAEILMPTVEGGSLEYHSGGGYGAFGVIVDKSGNVVAKTGHGDDRYAKSGTVQFDGGSGQQTPSVSSPTPTPVPSQTSPVPSPTPTPVPSQTSPPRQQSTASIERQASYDQPDGGGTTLLAQAPSVSSSRGSMSGGGSSVIVSGSTGELLNSYYKRQLLGFLYKQG